jgi:O-antigen/teichoic acid export membrane protein
MAVAGTRVLLLVLGTVASVVIARSLGPAGRGRYAFAVAVATTAIALSHASIEQAQVYLISTGTSLRRLAANAVGLGLALGLVAGAGVLLLCALFGWPTSAPFSDVPLLLALAAVPVSIAVLYTNGLLVLAGNTRLLNRAGLVAGGAQCATLVLLGATGRLSVPAVVAVWAVSAALPLLVSLPHLKPRVGDASWDLARQEIGIGLRYHAGLASLYLLLRVDVLILAALRSDTDVGLYSLAVGLVELTNVAADAVAMVILRRQATEALHQAAALTARVVGLTVVLASLVAGGLCLLGPTVVPLVYGRAFSDAMPSLYALAPGVLALAASRALGGYLIRLNKPWTYTILTTIAMLTNVGLNLVLIPRYGPAGAGLATSAAYILLALLMVRWFRLTARLPLTAFSPVHRSRGA